MWGLPWPLAHAPARRHARVLLGTALVALGCWACDPRPPATELRTRPVIGAAWDARPPAAAWRQAPSPNGGVGRAPDVPRWQTRATVAAPPQWSGPHVPLPRPVPDARVRPGRSAARVAAAWAAAIAGIGAVASMVRSILSHSRGMPCTSDEGPCFSGGTWWRDTCTAPATALLMVSSRRNRKLGKRRKTPGPMKWIDPPPPVVPIPKTGVCTKWWPHRGFGFLQPDDGGPELFVHWRSIETDGVEIGVGEAVAFDEVPGESPGAAPVAVNVTARGGGPVVGAPWWQVETGVVTRWWPEKGYGFVQPDDGSDPVLVHEACLPQQPLPPERRFKGQVLQPPKAVLRYVQQQNVTQLAAGDRVEFRALEDEFGRRKAVYAQKLPEPEAEDETDDFDVEDWLGPGAVADEAGPSSGDDPEADEDWEHRKVDWEALDAEARSAGWLRDVDELPDPKLAPMDEPQHPEWPDDVDQAGPGCDGPWPAERVPNAKPNHPKTEKPSDDDPPFFKESAAQIV